MHAQIKVDLLLLFLSGTDLYGWGLSQVPLYILSSLPLHFLPHHRLYCQLQKTKANDTVSFRVFTTHLLLTRIIITTKFTSRAHIAYIWTIYNFLLS